jgi:hypothetical protein
MKKTILFLWVLLLPGVATVFAESGDFGENNALHWELNNSTLTISGTGAMPNYSNSGFVPWYSYRFSIETVMIEDGVTSIGDYVFYDCENLASVTIGNSVESIGNYVFYGCDNLASVIIPEGVTGIGDYIFYGCGNLALVILPEGMMSIGDYAFYDCYGITSLTIPVGVTSIGEWAFSGCNFTSLTIPEGVTGIGDFTFSGCNSLLSVTIPNSVTSIGIAAFSYCNHLISIIIPNRVTSIGGSAFNFCSRLISVIIGNGVTSIGDGAFYYCTELTSVTNLNPTPQAIDADMFNNVAVENATLYVPAGSVAAYEDSPVWGAFGTITAYVPSAIDAPATANAIRIYSDPATGSFRIEGLTAPTQVTVSNANGQTVLRQTVREGENIATGYLPSGVYLVNVNGQTIKIIQ